MRFVTFRRTIVLASATAVGLALGLVRLPGQEPAPGPEIAPPPDSAVPPADVADEESQDFEALTRGPMHEAFASPYVADPQPGVIIPDAPPEPIDELAPDMMPEGDNVVWIPGYWGWDPDAQQFLWISGVWRDVPADRRWIPGYWAEVDEGFQWVPGFWTTDETTELVYQPVPPESLEQGPNVEAPEGDYFWIPGNWVWQETQYDWRPGYWAPSVADWVWIPDQYVWTPYGCVYVPGYWDTMFNRRGMMFAPVHFTTPVYQQPGYHYTPTVVIDTAPLLIHMFVSPTYCHYYYGDYYGYQPRHPNFHFHPWYTYAERPQYYDPMLTYYQWSYGRRNIDIVHRLSSWNRYFVSHVDYRPRHTYRAQRRFYREHEHDHDRIGVDRSTLAFAAPLTQYVDSRGGRSRFRAVDEPVRNQISERRQSMRQFQRERSQFEIASSREASIGRAAPRPGDTQDARPDANRARKSLKLPESTVTARRNRADGEAGRDRPPGAGRPGPDAQRPQTPPRPRPAAGAGRPDAGRPGTERPGAERPGAGRPGAYRPGADRPGADRPGADRPGADRPGADRPGTDRPGTRDPGRAIPRFRSRPQQPDAADRPGTAPGGERPGVARPGDRPGADRPGADRPGSGRPGADRRGANPLENLPPGVRDGRRPPGAGPGAESRPGQPRPGQPGANRPGSDQPGAGAGRGRSSPPGAARPGGDRPGAGTSGPQRRETARPIGPAPRAGQGTPGAGQGARQRPAARPGAGQPEAGRRGTSQPRPRPEAARPDSDRPGAVNRSERQAPARPPQARPGRTGGETPSAGNARGENRRDSNNLRGERREDRGRNK